MFLVTTVTPALFLSDLVPETSLAVPDCESGLSTAVLRAVTLGVTLTIGVMVGIVSVRVLTAMKGVGSGSLVVASFWARSTSSLSLACIAARCWNIKMPPLMTTAKMTKGRSLRTGEVFITDR